MKNDFSEELFETIFSKAGDGIFLSDARGICIEVNPQGCEMLGYARAELIGLAMSDLIAAEEIESALQKMEELKDGHTLVSESIMLRKDGSPLPVEISGTLLSNGHMLGLVRDISARKLAQQSMSELAAQWQATFDAITDAVMLLNREQRILRSNRAMQTLFQLSEKELAGKFCWEVVHGSPGPIPQCPFQRMLKTLRRESLDLFREGRWLDITVDPVFDEHGSLLAVIHIIRDATERKLAEAALLESKMAAESYLNIAAEIIISLDKYGNVTHLNESGHHLLGYEQEELIGRNWFDTCLREAEKADLKRFFKLLESGETGAVESRENTVITKNGEIKTILWHNTILRDKDKLFIGTLSSGEDITERIEMEKTLRIALAKYKTLFESFPLGVTITNEVGDILETNPTAVKLLAVPREEHTRRSIDGAEWRIVRLDGTPMTSDEYASVRALKENRIIENVEMGIVKPDHSTTWLSVTAAPLPLEGHGVVVTYGDITARKRTEDLLRTRIRLGQFADTHTLDELLQRTLDEAEILTGSQIGFAHFLEEDQKTLVLQTWSTNTLKNMCSADGKGEHYPVGEAGVWVDCVYAREPVIHNDYASLAHRKGLPEGHAPVVRELVVPVIHGDLIVAIFGVGNKPADYTQADVETLLQLATLTWDIIQRKRAEEASRRMERHYKALIEKAPDGIVLLSRSGRFQYSSPSAHMIFGYDADDVYDTRPDEATHPEDLPRVMEAISALIEDPTQTPTLQYRFRHKDGSWRWVESIFSNLLDEPGVEAVVINFRDITEHRQVQQAMQESEEKYRQLFALGADAFFLVDNETGFIQDVNHVASELYGYSREELLNLRNVDLSAQPEDTRKATLFGVTKIPVRYHRRKDGTVFPVEITASHITYRGRPAHIAAIRDISERFKAEQALIESEEKFRSLVEQSPDGIIIVDEEGMIVEWNHGQEQISGVKRSEAMGRPVWEIQYRLQPDETRTPDFTERIKRSTLISLSSGEGTHFNQPREAVIQLPDGSRRNIEVVMYGYRTELGYRLGSLTRDITERKQVEMRLEYLAMHDELTGLPNRQLFNDRLVLALERARRERQGMLAVMLLDLDNFKEVNDTYGHAYGDQLLRIVAQRLQSCLRKSDTAARMGGDEFTIILEEVSGRESCILVAQKVLDALSDPMEIEGIVLHITASLGISLYPTNSEDVVTLLRQADIAMYRAKIRGNDIQFYITPK
jgi:diguanylate cyclase (GGDEF)-like protein/PAS domain S-box-containing protein